MRPGAVEENVDIEGKGPLNGATSHAQESLLTPLSDLQPIANHAADLEVPASSESDDNRVLMRRERASGLADPARRLLKLVRQDRVMPLPDRIALRSTVAALLVTASLLTNRSYLGWGLFVIFAILFVPFSRFRSFLLFFVPYAGVWFLFTALRSLADETLWARKINTYVASFERWLFGGELPTISLQDRWFDPFEPHWYDYFLTFVHWSYFIIPHIVAVRLWQRSNRAFQHYLLAMSLLLTFGLVLYFIVPSNPPWMAPESVNSPSAATALRGMEPVAQAIGGGLYSAGYRVVGESNPIAAMPSIHMAITFLLVFAARQATRAWRLLAWFYSGLMGLALIYLGEHYVVDVVAGALVTTASWYAAAAWLKARDPASRRRGSIREVKNHSLPASSLTT